jgi:predicted component of type VI protein secretion system
MLSLAVHILDSNNRPTRHASFVKSPVHIGRNQLNELALSEPFISMWHGLIRFDANGIQYVDVGSTNGSMVNGERIATGVPTDIHPNTDFRIGTLKVKLSLEEVDAGTVAPAARHQTQFGMRVSQLPGTFTGSASRRLSQSEVAAVSGPLPAEQVSGVHDIPVAVKDLFAGYLAYRKAYVGLHQAIAERLTSLPAEQRQDEVGRLLSRFPALKQEQPFRELLHSLDTPLLDEPAKPAVPTPTDWKQVPRPEEGAGPPDSREAPVTALLGAFAKSYLPNESASLASAVDAERFLDRLAEVLETFGKSFVELQRGQTQFGQEINVRIPSGAGGLHRAHNGEEVLAYLLDWRVDGAARVGELVRGFADLMIHQLGLLNGVKAGVRALLDRLGPESVDKEVAKTKLQLGPLAVPGTLWPLRSLARWRAYLDILRRFEEEEQAIRAVVFGHEFARAYAIVMGESHAPDGSKGNS